MSLDPEGDQIFKGFKSLAKILKAEDILIGTEFPIFRSEMSK